MSMFLRAAGGLALAAVLSISATTGIAATIVSAVSATSTSTFPSDNGINRAIDQSGLDTTYQSGVDDFDDYLALDPLHGIDTFGQEWFSNQNAAGAVLTFDLGEVMDIDRVAIWNEDQWGFLTAQIAASVDGITFTDLGAIFPVSNPARQNYGRLYT